MSEVILGLLIVVLILAFVELALVAYFLWLHL